MNTETYNNNIHNEFTKALNYSSYLRTFSIYSKTSFHLSYSTFTLNWKENPGRRITQRCVTKTKRPITTRGRVASHWHVRTFTHYL